MYQVLDRDSWKLTAATITGKGGVPPVLRRAGVAFWPERDVRAKADIGCRANLPRKFLATTEDLADPLRSESTLRVSRARGLPTIRGNSAIKQKLT